MPDRYKFRYRLLASADIIGSTSFKSGRASEQLEWAHVFRNFFDEFPEQLAQSFEKSKSTLTDLGEPPKACMEIWKFVGDEILFVAELTRHQEAAFHVVAIKDALNAYSAELASKYPSLGLKGTVWGAGFPVMNVEVETRTAGRDKARDFLGPSIDLGFRLASAADRRRIPISADVALFLRHARNASNKLIPGLKMYVDPPQVLKGIQSIGGYPMVWVDRLDGKSTPEDILLGRDRSIDNGDALLQYLEEQFDTNTIGLCRPFIESDPSHLFHKIPPQIAKQRDQLSGEDLELKYAEQSEPRATGKRGKKPIAPPLPKVSKIAGKAKR